MPLARNHNYRSSRSKRKKSSRVIYITYDVERKTRYGAFMYAKVKRVPIAGPIKEWRIGEPNKKSDSKIRSMRILYEAKRPLAQRVTLPHDAMHIRLFSKKSELSAKYLSILKNKE